VKTTDLPVGFWTIAKLRDSARYRRPVLARRPGQLALLRSADRVRKCLLFGVDRTYRKHHETDAFDPKQTYCPTFSIEPAADPMR